MAKKTELIAASKISGDMFRRFAFFDTFYLKKRWRSPLLFLLLMTGFSVVCFLFRDRQRGAALLAGVLLGVGLLLPAGYFLSFLLSVSKRAKLVNPNRIAYTLHLSADQIRVLQNSDQVTLQWSDVYRAYRVEDGIYLYANPTRAFLITDTELLDAVWTLFAQQVAATRLFDRRRGINR